jgi:hypothetical protein
MFCVAHKPVPVALPAGYYTLGVNSFQEAHFYTGSGNNINHKNSRYSEVSAIYWLLNNINPDLEGLNYWGLCHYRRFFFLRPPSQRIVGSKEQLDDLSGFEKILSKYSGFAPIRHNFNRSLLQFYSEKHEGKGDDLLLAYRVAVDQGVFTKDFAEQQLLGCTELTPFCMSILPQFLFRDLWGRIIEVLLQIEPSISSHTSTYQNRNMGFIAERLHSSALAYLELTGALSLCRVPVVQIETN